MKDALVAALMAFLAVLAAMSSAEHSPANAGLPLVQADYQKCVTVRTAPLKPSKRPVFYPNLSEIS